MKKKFDEMTKKDINVSIIISWYITIASLIVYVVLGIAFDYNYRWATILLIISALSYSIVSNIRHWSRGIVIKDEE
ncbi:hypothetical protein [Anaeromicropila herbilytica]|uniref:Uncharacterized protein n=1 Tax=Anaeromicropila herbilytica TaxID=2785025 RepID=A0A7R7IBX6_9FIRM|nr:hypothetical protein [Anaeromicropila herbilytica]BCN30108.1 hypothetical protein bsdtb5_14030 [Anaeromicropila herbilytica]